MKNIRGTIMEMLKKKFGGLTFWETIEAEVAVLISSLPEPKTDKKRIDLIKKLKELKNFLLSQGIKSNDIECINEQIDLHEKTNQISLYVEEEDKLDSKIIEKYSRLGDATEGVIGIHLPLNYSQLKKLTNGVYEKTQLIKFYISRERTVCGKVIAEIYEYPQKIPIATLLHSKRRDKGTEEPVSKYVSLFGEAINKNKYSIVKEINIPFYVYRFITETNVDLILISSTRCEIGEYVVTGVVSQTTNYRMLTDSARLITKLPFLFAQEIKSRIIKFKSHEEFKKRVEHFKISKENFFDYPFSVRVKTKMGKLTKKIKKMIHPTWYKWLLWAWLTHETKGLFNTYPLHLMVLGPKNSGKSLLLNALHAKSRESRRVSSGVSSTLKGIVPSFKYNPAKIGYLAESNRFAFLDEFLRCLRRTRTKMEGSEREESVAMMNDLLEHQKREAGSGISKVNVNMTARILAASNPVKGINNMEDLIHNLDESFLSRWLIYYQTDDHVRSIRRSNDGDLEDYDFRLSDRDWVSFLDYLHTFSAKYDTEKVKEIHQLVTNVLSEDLRDHFDARHFHHIECLIDGIVKTRCFLEQDTSFQAKEEDYKILKKVWTAIIRSWVNADMIKRMEVKNRIFYLPEQSQWLYWKIVEFKRPVGHVELRELMLKDMSNKEYMETLVILVDMGVLKDWNGQVMPHYMTELDDKEQERL